MGQIWSQIEKLIFLKSWSTAPETLFHPKTFKYSNCQLVYILVAGTLAVVLTLVTDGYGDYYDPTDALDECVCSLYSVEARGRD